MRNIDPILLAKIKEQNQTVWNNANPKMNVVVARAKSSIRDSSYFTIETIRKKEGITDVAVAARRMKPIGRPDRIYGIHIDNGIAKTSFREYPDKLKEHWKYQFDVGPAKAVSICIDGRWYMNYKKTWGLQTDEVPWIFWVDLAGKLYARIWETGTTYELATDVVKFDSLRGWIPAQAGHTDDQGIIVAYVKSDGKVYYRNYCLQSDGVNIIWETEKEVTLFGSSCLGVRLFRSNDFRVGFIAEKAAGNLMAITERNWAGMSIAPESLYAKVSVDIDFIPLEFIDVVSQKEYMTADVNATTYLCPIDKLDITPISIDRPSTTELTILFDTDLYNIDADGFTVTNDTDVVSYEVSSAAFNSATKVLTLTLTTTMDASYNIKVAYTGDINNIRVVDDDYCKLELDSFELIHEGYLPPQDGYEIEYLTAGVTTTISLKTIEFISISNQKEYLTAYVNTSIQLWNVDDSPV
ncbi:MAG: SwmB domain-containing protein [Rikenellaceae bacterium]